MAGPVKILLVEDSAAAVALAREALAEAKVPNTLEVAGDGVQAMDYLRRSGAASDTRPPDIVLLDLNLPRKSGREVLAEIKSDPALRRIPVVILTSSASPADVTEAYERHANAYVRKPTRFDELVNVMVSIGVFWLTVATLPPR